MFVIKQILYRRVNMKKIVRNVKRMVTLGMTLLCALGLGGCIDDDCDESNNSNPGVAYKPVIYLYPEEEMEVSVKLDYDGTFTSTYPAYEDGWKVMAKPDGTLYSEESGREYYCLFWEGISDTEYDLSKGFVVPGDETEAFLEDALAKLGLTEKESNEFIIFWMPQMEHNKYNYISFQGDAYTDSAKLDVSPTPDTVIRVFMVWQGLDESMDIEPQKLEKVERKGFTVVEWGGSEIEK